MSRRAAVRETFDRNAGTYDQHAALEAEVCRRLLERVAYRRGDPGVIIDLGCGTGVGLASLKRSFRKAQVMGLDLSRGMLARARGHARLTRPIRLVEADLAALPIAAHSADLVFSNLALPWVERWDRVFEDVSRVLKPGGMFLFSMYGAGSLPQLVSALAESGVRPPAFPDILVVGDALTAAGFREPVMDVDLITMDYPGLDDMAREIEATGTALLLEDWPKLRSVLGSLERNWSRDGDNQRFPLGFEIVYGAAFGAPEGQPRRTAEGEVATFSVDSLLKSRNLL
jgi:malonyl-CoA O-methyltransferase